ncbi:hypothetical protein NHP21005_03210 [Helicobacter sp. NHP21005]|uniref:replication initiation protein n=1 Tax=Helicobacter felistomachi TaxID=3040201 RepID=UPI0025738A90|nr:replication initiation protein [Helicobacter sp. NHP21005]BEG56633.1 hypothetical protein NHP21005_03210 [Helicobacter sp. NHP21005]
MDNTIRPILQKNIEDSIKDCIEHIQTILTTWTERVDTEEMVSFNHTTQIATEVVEVATTRIDSPQVALQTQSLQSESKETPQEVSKTPPQQEPHRALAFTTQEPQKASVLYENIRVHNPGQVALHNDMYKVKLGNLGALESNLLFSIFNIIKEQGDTIVHFNPKELKAIIGYPNIKNSELIKIVKGVWKKIGGANFWILLPRRDENHILFRTFAINYYDDAKTKVKDIEIQVNHPHFTYLLNALKGNFTAFQLKKFLSIKGKYAKGLFRLIERFKDKVVNGYITINTYKNDFKGFCEYMGIPKNYEMRAINIMYLPPLAKNSPTPKMRSKNTLKKCSC